MRGAVFCDLLQSRFAASIAAYVMEVELVASSHAGYFLGTSLGSKQMMHSSLYVRFGVIVMLFINLDLFIRLVYI